MASASTRARKTATNLSLRTDLVQRAKSLKINLSSVVEAALESEIRTREQQAWLCENRDAIRAYNDRVHRDGVFGDRIRRF
ncbi:type II toxin-antitoxin system CcdA family antitoxin [Candidatus Binatia bacterium]|jgi:antitoxin CcdA|nr:type II toxin-antitoxin system CcdA family antitoxin [Candidatus Binatia bacterium]